MYILNTLLIYLVFRGPPFVPRLEFEFYRDLKSDMFCFQLLSFLLAQVSIGCYFSLEKYELILSIFLTILIKF